MNVALRIPRMTRAFFLDWAETQNERYEFDGFEPVAPVAEMAAFDPSVTFPAHTTVEPLNVRSAPLSVKFPPPLIVTVCPTARP